MSYFLADTSYNALFYVSPRYYSSTLSSNLKMRHPVSSPLEPSASSVVDSFQQLSFILLIFLCALFVFILLEIKLLILLIIAGLIGFLVYMRRTVNDIPLTQIYNPAPYNDKYKYKVILTLPPVCDILTVICDLHNLRSQWMPFVADYNCSTNTLTYKGEDGVNRSRIQTRMTVQRFKHQRTYYIYEREAVERVFVIQFLSNSTRVAVYGNAENNYVHKLRIDLMKVYMAMGALAQINTRDTFALTEGGRQDLPLINETEEIDYGENAQDDKSERLGQSTVNQEEEKKEKFDPLTEELLREAIAKEQRKMSMNPEMQFEHQLAQIENPEWVDYIRLARRRVLLMLELGEADGWKEIGKKNGVTIYNKSMEHNIKAVMGRGTMPYSVQQIAEYISDEDQHPNYDPNFDLAQLIETLPLGTSITYQRFKGRSIVASRDFCILSQRYTPPGTKTLVVGAGSCEHQKCPLVKKCVRAECYVGGWKLTPDEKTPDELTHVVYLTWSNLKGQLPQSIVNSAIRDQGFQILEVTKAMDRKFKRK